MSNYPPGVTGFEFEIAGPDHESEESVACPVCGQDTEVIVASYGGDAWYEAQCGYCGHEWTWEGFAEDFGGGYDESDALWEERCAEAYDERIMW